MTMLLHRTATAAAGFALALLAAPALAAAPAPMEFTVLKDGKPIGEETYTFSEAPNGALTVEVETRTDVQVLFLKFHYRHQRTEVWEDGVLTRMTAKTDDDGEPHKIALAREDGGYRVEADGAIRREAPDVLPLTLWTPKVLEHDRVLSIIDAEPYAVEVEEAGTETLDGEEAVKYEMSGDIDRDLWYSPDGQLLKVQFTRSGYNIEYVRR
ncbi:hypothetical protein C882_2228 [Caenispirillum salinarum AK4]|uniref:DUF3108 domain-containing protein n=1 Tax=Caenispirillum salinarum AK4 TaxID=1238182 RepID=K9HD07_9PROT|nr:DUF6134 family protein [Caenispirillum salinarum]EKV26601.1 hypothetical protein C882_2228 [Caenispirillum salinarum AK4]